MNRKMERGLVMVGATWQIVSGLLTIFVYASLIKKEGLNSSSTTFAKLEAVQSIFGSLYMFAVSFGMLFVILGIVNIILAKTMKHTNVDVKRPLWFILLGVASYFVMDLIGAFMFLSAGILALAKNKSISKIRNAQVEVL